MQERFVREVAVIARRPAVVQFLFMISVGIACEYQSNSYFTVFMKVRLISFS